MTDFPATTVKVVIAGPFAAGKTTFISHVSQTPVVQTETATFGDESGTKDHTTVSLDYGTYTLEDPAGGDVELLLFGTPGQARFRFMIDIAAVGMDGFLLLVDGSKEETHDEAREILNVLSARGATPYLIAVNRVSDDETARTIAERIAPGMGHLARPVNVTDEAGSVNLLIDLLLTIADSLLSADGV